MLFADDIAKRLRAHLSHPTHHARTYEVVASLLPAGDLAYAHLPAVYVATVKEVFAPPKFLYRPEQHATVDLTVTIVARLDGAQGTDPIAQLQRQLRLLLRGYCPPGALTGLQLTSSKIEPLEAPSAQETVLSGLAQWRDCWQLTYILS